MNPHAPPPNAPLAVYLVPLAVIALVILRASRARQLRVERMWVGPVLILAITAMSLLQQPPSGPAAIGLDVVALAVGGFLGWHRGRFTRVTVDPDTHVLTSQTSPVGMLLILGVFVVRFAVRMYAVQNAGALHMPVSDLTDAFLLLAVGLVCAQRLEVGLRATRLLRQARGA